MDSNSQHLYFKLILAVVSLGFISSCSSSKISRSFNYCLEGEPSTFNPQMAVDGDTFDASSQTVYNRLLSFAPGTTRLQPSLAKSWQILEGGRRVRFFLRDKVSFHSNALFAPTRFLNSDDVLFSFKRMRDTNHPYHSVGSGRYVYFESSGISSLLDDVVKVSDLVVDFKIKNPDATFLSTLAMDFTSILSKEYAEHLLKTDQKELLDFKPIGTGPFVFKSYKESKNISYTKNSKYFLKPPKIENLFIKIVPGVNNRVKMLLNGGCDFIKSPPLENISRLMKNKKIKVVETPALNVSYLAFNNEKEKFKNKEIRSAIAQAMNRKKYIELVYSRRASLAGGPLPPQILSYSDLIRPIKYDPKESKKIIKKYYPIGDLSVELWILPIARPYLPNANLLAKFIKQDLNKVGIDVNLVTYNWNAFLEKTALGEHEMVLYGWTADSGDPDNFLNLLLSCPAVEGGSNLAKFCNPLYDQYVLNAKRVMNPEIRELEYLKALQIFRRELPLVPIAHSKTFKVMRSVVKGYTPSLFGTESFKNVYLTDWSKN